MNAATDQVIDVEATVLDESPKEPNDFFGNLQHTADRI